jgi:glutamate N-acetyltransferase/amino-acid N-acetyltransferase
MTQWFSDLDGVFAGGIHSGSKASGKKDLAYIYVPNAVASAGVFTQNQCCGANITLTRKSLKTNTLKAVLINSGNANAATGIEGAHNTKRMAKKAAECLGLKPSEVGIASTGIIGVQLKIDKIEAGIETLLADPKQKDGESAAAGIMTTDLVEKHVFKEAKIGKKTIQVAGIAKGSGMIEPNMATMLSFLVTNADVPQDVFQAWLKEAVDESFNMISVDTDTSTSDMVLAFATGERQFNLRSKEEVDAYKVLLTDVCIELGKKIARDGEGATKLIECQVTGAAKHSEARAVAKSVINSPLIKTAIHGGDPNWGRLLMAVGKTPGIKVNPSKLSFKFGNCLVFKDGEPTAFDADEASNELKKEHVIVAIDMGLSTGQATAWGCDLTKGYIDINVDYN